MFVKIFLRAFGELGMAPDPTRNLGAIPIEFQIPWAAHRNGCRFPAVVWIEVEEIKNFVLIAMICRPIVGVNSRRNDFSERNGEGTSFKKNAQRIIAAFCHCAPKSVDIANGNFAINAGKLKAGDLSAGGIPIGWIRGEFAAPI